MITLSSKVTWRCWKFAVDLCEHYASGGSPNSRAVTYRGADYHVPLQARAKMAECIFSEELNLDPLEAVKWDLQADAGADFLNFGFRFDIKASGPNAGFLIWPKGKNHIFAGKQFDALVLVRLNGENKDGTASGASVGFILKDDFAAQKLIAGAGHQLDPGTWHMRLRDLCPMDALLEAHRHLGKRGNGSRQPAAIAR